jgi:hypothetical protein
MLIQMDQRRGRVLGDSFRTCVTVRTLKRPVLLFAVRYETSTITIPPWIQIDLAIWKLAGRLQLRTGRSDRERSQRAARKTVQPQ